MSLISFVVFIVIIGLVLWLFNTQIPVPGWVKMVVNVLAVLVVIIWLLQFAGFAGPSLRWR